MFAQTLSPSYPPGPFIILSKVDSTNNYAMAKLHAGMPMHGFAFMALVQTSGKGQRGKHWQVQPGENITMSTVLSLPDSLSPAMLIKIQSFPFLLSACAALGCYDFIKGFHSHDISIKWPNDLYIGDRKAGGILIENMMRSGKWTWSVVGTGININQVSFPGLTHKATSLAQVTGHTYDVSAAGKILHHCLMKRYATLEYGFEHQLMEEYNAHLFRSGNTVRLKKENAVFTTTIEKVDMAGRLLTIDQIRRSFSVGEVEFI